MESNLTFIAKISPQGVTKEDNGAFKSFYFENNQDNVFGVELRSYDESVWDNNPNAHKTFNSLKGKKLKVTIEVID